MSVVFLGDLGFNQLLSSELFRSRFTISHSVFQVTNIGTLANFRIAMPGETQYLVIGCLQTFVSSLQGSKDETREVTISEWRSIIKKLLC